MVFLFKLYFLYKGDKISVQFTRLLSHRLVCVWHTGWRGFVLESTFFLDNLICHELKLHIHPNNWLTRCLWHKRLISTYFQRSAICSSRWLLTFITHWQMLFCARGGKLFCNGPDSKCFQLLSSLWQLLKLSHRQYVTVKLCPSQTIFTKLSVACRL